MAVNVDRAKLAEVLGGRVPPGIAGVVGVTHDSRAVEPGFAFVAVPGFKRDGAEFAAAAARRGAALVVAERAVEGLPAATPVVVVPDARAALAGLARAVFGDPSQKLEVYGVTGTNGKTTTSYVLHAVLARAFGEESCGLMTTVETVTGGRREPSVRTTPEAVEVQGTLARMLEAGVRRVVMEVSSHGIALRRVGGTRFAGAVFTNLTRDHLDLHGSMENYYATKRELFRWSDGPKLAGVGDPWGRRLAREIWGTKTFGPQEDADYRVANVRRGRTGTAFTLERGAEVLELETPLLGGYNAMNVAGAAALALEVGVDEGMVEEAVRGMGQVPGRFERVPAGGEFEVIVDYAHTDVGLEAVLGVARGMAGRRENGGRSGRVICVFGAAGERDGDKRPRMGSVAARLADRSIVTTDDAYAEDPARIARQVASGANGAANAPEVVLDRREAIRRALLTARAGDVVVVAGKGHERVQHLPGGDVPFHDAGVVRELLEELGKTGR